MKRVRYLASAASLAPLAFGTTIAAAAPQTAATPPAAPKHGKTVILNQPHAVAAGCAGYFQAGATGTSEFLKFWYRKESTGLSTGETCIGTVIYSEYNNAFASEDMRTRIRVPPGGAIDYSAYTTGRHGSVHGRYGNIFSVGVHRLFATITASVQVCTAEVAADNHNNVIWGPICRNVP